MKAKIVQFENGGYAIRKGWWLFKRYADLNDLKYLEDDIYWWGDMDASQYFSTPSITEIEIFVENYNNRNKNKNKNSPKKTKERTIQHITLK
jgi:hypothetical protein